MCLREREWCKEHTLSFLISLKVSILYLPTRSKCKFGVPFKKDGREDPRLTSVSLIDILSDNKFVNKIRGQPSLSRSCDIIVKVHCYEKYHITRKLKHVSDIQKPNSTDNLLSTTTS